MYGETFYRRHTALAELQSSKINVKTIAFLNLILIMSKGYIVYKPINANHCWILLANDIVFFWGS